MRSMSREEAIGFLLEGTRTGKLATVSEDGKPHVVPIWFVIEDDAVVFTTWHESVKLRNLAKNARASMVVDLEEPPYAYVVVEGTVTLSHELKELRSFATRIGGRYMGEDRADEYGNRNGVPGEVVVRLQIEKIIAKDDISG